MTNLSLSRSIRGISLKTWEKYMCQAMGDESVVNDENRNPGLRGFVDSFFWYT